MSLSTFLWRMVGYEISSNANKFSTCWPVTEILAAPQSFGGGAMKKHRDLPQVPERSLLKESRCFITPDVKVNQDRGDAEGRETSCPAGVQLWILDCVPFLTLTC